MHRVRPLDPERKLPLVIKNDPDVLSLPPSNMTMSAPRSQRVALDTVNTPRWRLTSELKVDPVSANSDCGLNQSVASAVPHHMGGAVVSKVGRPRSKRRGRPRGKSKRSGKVSLSHSLISHPLSVALSALTRSITILLSLPRSTYSTSHVISHTIVSLSHKAPRGWKRPPRYIQCRTVVRGGNYDLDTDVGVGVGVYVGWLWWLLVADVSCLQHQC